MSATSRPIASSFTGKRFLVILVGCFAPVFAVNGGMAYLAISTFSGLDGDDSYRKGLYYNATLAEAQQQEALGWSAHVCALPERAGIELVLTDKSGAPLTGITVSGMLGRPTTNRFDRALILNEVGAGHYRASFASPLDAGGWVATLTAQARRGDARYQLRQRLWLK